MCVFGRTFFINIEVLKNIDMVPVKSPAMLQPLRIVLVFCILHGRQDFIYPTDFKINQITESRN